MRRQAPVPFRSRTPGRRKDCCEEGRRKKEEGRRKKEEGVSGDGLVSDALDSTAQRFMPRRFLGDIGQLSVSPKLCRKRRPPPEQRGKKSGQRSETQQPGLTGAYRRRHNGHDTEAQIEAVVDQQV
jgi:hypothetical protein